MDNHLKNKELPVVSVLLPVYNGADFLAESVQSILDQTFTDFELLIINDCSTDRTEEVILSFTDSRISYVKNEQNLRLPATLNKGLKLCRGRFVARADHDDICLPGRLQKQIDFMNSRPEIAVCGGFVQVFGSLNEVWTYPTEPDEIKSYLLFSCPLAHPSVMMRREILLKNNFFYDENLRFAEDYDLWIRIAAKFYLANLPEPLIRYRLHNAPDRQSNLSDADRFTADLRLKQLRNLGLEPTDEELEIHRKIGDNLFDKSADFLPVADRWLRKLRRANRKMRIYPEPVFSEVLYWRGKVSARIFLEKAGISKRKLLSDRFFSYWGRYYFFSRFWKIFGR